MTYSLLLSIPLLVGCLFILLQNISRSYHRPSIFNFALNSYLRATSSFMAACGLILFTKCVTKTPFLRTSGDDVPSNLVDTICSKNSSISILPTAWFKEVNNEILRDSFRRYDIYCMMAFVYAINLVVVEILSELFGGQIRKLIPLATSIILPNDNKEERKKAIVRQMTNKVTEDESYFHYFVYAEFLCFLIGIICLISNPINTSSYRDFAVYSVHLNDSKWTVDCDRQATSQDIFTLMECQYKYTDRKYESICIVPTNNIYFHLHIGISLCSVMLAISCAAILMYRSCKIKNLGSRRMNDILLVSLLKNSVDFTQHKEIIDAFERKLDESRRARMDRTRPLEQAGQTYNRDTETVNLSVGICTPD